MSMSRKNYQEVAEIIKSNLQQAEMLTDRGDVAAAQQGITYIARDLAGMFKRDNGRFDRERFMEACGL